MLTAAPEPFAPFLDEVKPLLPRHWEELALDKDLYPLAPQYDVYLDRDARGEVFLIAMRSAGQLVGYFIGFVTPGLHYSTCLTLTPDIFWIAPEFRGQRGGAMLFQAVETEVRRRGIDRMFVGTKVHLDCSGLFDALGYTRVEAIYSKTFTESE